MDGWSGVPGGLQNLLAHRETAPERRGGPGAPVPAGLEVTLRRERLNSCALHGPPWLAPAQPHAHALSSSIAPGTCALASARLTSGLARASCNNGVPGTQKEPASPA